ncbi:MAG: LysM peptidoglycan-binding domain-containing protein [Deltaproteobacteria bacterium]|nr:LysM peptidoglycan-binding domain-containing protein [Deltaproteobacteria bacterium]
MTNRKHGKCRLISFFAVTLFFIIYPFTSISAEGENEETYSIDLVQTAEVSKEIVDLDDKKVLTETYVAKDGDHIWQILRSREVFNKNRLGDILYALKKLNKSLDNMDMIHPGQKIVIPLIITPVPGRKPPENREDIETISITDLENPDLYTVMPGDSIIRILDKKFSMPESEFYNEYLDQLKKLNPGLTDLNTIYPGQKVRLPIYSPQIVRVKIKEETPEKGIDEEAIKLQNREKGEHLGRIFTLIGEEWLSQGKHYIPLNTGGQIDLNTETYPIISLRNGDKIIVDLYSTLPEKMADLIRSNWDSYRIIHIDKADDLTAVIDKAISACNYSRVYDKDESLVLEEGFRLEITADWIIRTVPEASDAETSIICLNLGEKGGKNTPVSIKKYLEGHGIRIIDYPEGETNEEVDKVIDPITLGSSINSVVEKILELAEQPYSLKRDIPLYRGEGSDFNLTIKADYSFNRKGKDYIIDMNGLEVEVITLLNEHGFSVLSLAGEAELLKAAGRVFDFMGEEWSDSGEGFYALPKEAQGNVRLIVPGIIYRDIKGRVNLFTFIRPIQEISGFLATNVDSIFIFSRPEEAEENERKDTGN